MRVNKVGCFCSQFVEKNARHSSNSSGCVVNGCRPEQAQLRKFDFTVKKRGIYKGVRMAPPLQHFIKVYQNTPFVTVLITCME